MFRFEVMLLGKIDIKSHSSSHANVIDEAVKRYHELEVEAAAKVKLYNSLRIAFYFPDLLN